MTTTPGAVSEFFKNSPRRKTTHMGIIVAAMTPIDDASLRPEPKTITHQTLGKGPATPTTYTANSDSSSHDPQSRMYSSMMPPRSKIPSTAIIACIHPRQRLSFPHSLMRVDLSSPKEETQLMSNCQTKPRLFLHLRRRIKPTDLLKTANNTTSPRSSDQADNKHQCRQ